MATHHSRTASPSGGKAVGITLAPGPGRLAALAIVGVPLAIVLIFAFTTAGGGTSPSNGDGPIGTPTYPVATQPTSASAGTGQATPSEVPPSDTPLSTTDSVPVATPTASPTIAPSPVYPSTAATPSAAATEASATATPTGPAATVLAAYAAIDQRDYQAAYALGLGNPPPGESLQQYAAGYADTSSVAVTITAVQGDTVSVSLNSTQTDGDHQIFAGTYTVADGHITGAHVKQTN